MNFLTKINNRKNVCNKKYVTNKEKFCLTLFAKNVTVKKGYINTSQKSGARFISWRAQKRRWIISTRQKIILGLNVMRQIHIINVKCMVEANRIRNPIKISFL